MTILEFMGANPILTVILAYFVCRTLMYVTQAIRGRL